MTESSTRRAARPSRRRARGASMIEFALVFPVAALFVLGLIQLGFMYMARLTLNHATFMAAREGSLHNANTGTIKTALIRGLSAFYQDSSNNSDATRLATAFAKAELDAQQPWNLTITTLNPSASTFRDFGVRDPATRVTYIPNDNLEWRRTDIVGAASHENIRDANLLKLHVVYGYELKVPLIAGVLKRVMCGGSIGVNGWGNVSLLQAIDPASVQCLQYYDRGRVPIESYAIVEMQSRAEQP